MPRYFIIHKPYVVLSQFSTIRDESLETGNKRTLKDFFPVPVDVYPVGRLDYDSEGLLILTNDTQLNHRLLNPAFGHEREYWVQVEGTINEGAMNALRTGIEITVDGKRYKCAGCIVQPFLEPPGVPARIPPIRTRKNIPTSWIKMILTEGRNRQVRKMTAKAGFPTLRLIRYRIQRITIEGLQPGEMRELERDEIYSLLF